MATWIGQLHNFLWVQKRKNLVINYLNYTITFPRYGNVEEITKIQNGHHESTPKFFVWPVGVAV